MSYGFWECRLFSGRVWPPDTDGLVQEINTGRVCLERSKPEACPSRHTLLVFFNPVGLFSAEHHAGLSILSGTRAADGHFHTGLFILHGQQQVEPLSGNSGRQRVVLTVIFQTAGFPLVCQRLFFGRERLSVCYSVIVCRGGEAVKAFQVESTLEKPADNLVYLGGAGCTDVDYFLQRPGGAETEADRPRR